MKRQPIGAITMLKGRITKLRHELTLLVMTSEDNMKHWDEAEKDKFVVQGSTTIKPWEHKSLTPCHLMRIEDPKLAEKIYNLAIGNGKLGKVREDLEIYFIPQGGRYEGPDSLTTITAEKIGEPLTYMLSGDLLDLIPDLRTHSTNSPVILCWEEKKQPS